MNILSVSPSLGHTREKFLHKQPGGEFVSYLSETILFFIKMWSGNIQIRIKGN